MGQGMISQKRLNDMLDIVDFAQGASQTERGEERRKLSRAADRVQQWINDQIAGMQLERLGRKRAPAGSPAAPDPRLAKLEAIAGQALEGWRHLLRSEWSEQDIAAQEGAIAALRLALANLMLEAPAVSAAPE